MMQQSVEAQQTISNVWDQHKALLLQIDRLEEIDLEQVRLLLKTLAQAGTTIDDTEDRALLHELIRYWSSVINDKTGEFPALQLRPFDVSLRQSIPRRIPSRDSDIYQQSSSPTGQRNRNRFLTKLQSRYTDILDSSLQGAPQIGLAFYSTPNAVNNPIRLRLLQTDLSEQAFSTDTSLLDIYDQAGGEVLLLGEPGSGKTTLLLNLAQNLCQRAEQDEHALLPVIVNLSTWANTRKPLAEWLVDEIVKSYTVPRKPIAAWVEHEQILPLLDGLNEVDKAALPACIEAINSYKQQHLLPLVVCCRSREYESQQHRLMLQNAVEIQPLEEEQVDAYFLAAGETSSGIRSLLHKNTALRELLRTPLMLHVVTLTYQDVAMQDLLKKGTIQQQQIFDHYVQYMLQRQEMCFAPQAMRHWLSWLARQMQSHNRMVFYIEHLQPNWLPVSLQRAYDWLAVRLLDGFLGAFFSLAIASFLFSSFTSLSLSSLIEAILLGGFIGGLLSRGSVTRQHTTIEMNADSAFWRFTRQVGRGVLIGLSIGLIYSFISGLIYGQQFQLSNWSYSGLTYALIGGLFSGLLTGRSIAVQLTDRVYWPLRRLGRSLFSKQHIRTTGLVTALVFLSAGLIYGLSYGLNAGLIYGLSYGLNAGLIYWLLLGLFHGVSTETIDDQNRMIPNQGIRRSGFNGLTLGLIGSFIVGLISILSNWLLSRLTNVLNNKLSLVPHSFLPFSLSDWLLVGLIVGLGAGSLVGLISGGLASLRHFILRFLLWRAGAIPWNLPQFLNDADRCILLYRDGGGYRFTHRLLLEYFATLEGTIAPDEDAEHRRKMLQEPDEELDQST